MPSDAVIDLVGDAEEDRDGLGVSDPAASDRVRDLADREADQRPQPVEVLLVGCRCAWRRERVRQGVEPDRRELDGFAGRSVAVLPIRQARMTGIIRDPGRSEKTCSQSSLLPGW
jgi:hypothetical protein